MRFACFGLHAPTLWRRIFSKGPPTKRSWVVRPLTAECSTTSRQLKIVMLSCARSSPGSRVEWYTACAPSCSCGAAHYGCCFTFCRTGGTQKEQVLSNEEMNRELARDDAEFQVFQEIDVYACSRTQWACVLSNLMSALSHQPNGRSPTKYHHRMPSIEAHFASTAVALALRPHQSFMQTGSRVQAAVTIEAYSTCAGRKGQKR